MLITILVGVIGYYVLGFLIIGGYDAYQYNRSSARAGGAIRWELDDLVFIQALIWPFMVMLFVLRWLVEASINLMLDLMQKYHK